jgi:hypothetical protein
VFDEIAELLSPRRPRDAKKRPVLIQRVFTAKIREKCETADATETTRGTVSSPNSRAEEALSWRVTIAKRDKKAVETPPTKFMTQTELALLDPAERSIHAINLSAEGRAASATRDISAALFERDIDAGV